MRSKPVRASVRVVWEHKRLLLLPGGAWVVQAAVVAALVAVGSALWSGDRAGAVDVALVVVGVLLVTLVGTYANAALILAADQALQGRPVRIGRSCAAAAGRLPVIALWALVGVVAVSLGALLDRVPLVGPLLERLFGIGWAVVTYLALPAMMIDGLGVRDAMRRARRIGRGSGGRIVRGSIWTSLPVLVAIAPVLTLLVLGLSSDDHLTAGLAVVCAGLLAAASATVGTGLAGVFRTRLYREAEG
ncbi:DUF6159 family protein [Kitasatospora sp. NPDC056184]|uniref:DUF6159 family protein n=1 Tax=Kitasatospora sp. NPDC056184 TaxID=3345738 RepID=UPI0035DE0515